jgi:hypothetical protein
MIPFKHISLNRARRMLDMRHPKGPNESATVKHIPAPVTQDEIPKRKTAAMSAANKRK